MTWRVGCDKYDWSERLDRMYHVEYPKNDKKENKHIWSIQLHRRFS